jgi:hypothetical protein
VRLPLYISIDIYICINISIYRSELVCVCVCVYKYMERGGKKGARDLERSPDACKWNKSSTGANLEGCLLETYDGLELAERFGSKIFKISRV